MIQSSKLLPLVLGQEKRLRRQVADQLNQPACFQVCIAGEPVGTDFIDDALDAVADPDITFDSTLGVGLFQSFEDNPSVIGFPLSN